MKKKILIISSEPLTPEFTLGSTFELSQARILRSKYNVAIISVQVHNPLVQQLRTAVKTSILLRWGRAGNNFRELFKMSGRFIGNKLSWVEHSVIEDVDVYGGNGFTTGYIHGNEAYYNVWCDAAYAAYVEYEKKWGKPDLVHAHGRFMVAGLLALKLKKEHQVPYVYTEHSSRFPSGYVPSVAIPILNDIIDNCIRYIAVSKPLLLKVQETLDRDIGKAKVVPNVLDPVYEVPLNKNLPKESFNFLNIANLEHRKGLDILLRAFKRAFYGHHGYRLRLIGDGPQRGDLEELARYLEIDHVVEFLGEKSKFEIVDILDRTHSFVFPSRFETFGVSVIEAMARGCPVIVTSSGGPEQIVTPECGIIIQPEHENDLVKALRAMGREFDRYNLQEISRYCIDQYGGARFIEHMDEVYGDVLTVVNALKTG
jgi:glycosyltransferase involved in cell wall biosynthesis